MNSTLVITTGELPGTAQPRKDSIFRTRGTVIVLDADAAACPEQQRGSWYIQVLGVRLRSALEADSGASLRTVVERAIAAVAQRHRLVPGAAPAAAVAIVRALHGRVEALALGNAPIVAVARTGAVHQLRDDRLERLLTGRLEHIGLYARLRTGAGFTSPKHRELLDQLRDHQLRHLNKDGGYWAAEAAPDAARHALVHSWPAAEIEQVLVMNHAVAAAVEDYRLFASWHHLARTCRERGPQYVVRMIHTAETAEDPHGIRWPRYEPAGDKTLAHLDLTAALA
ncbi:hypothetical protein [Streptomyces aidingensis]|uniref:Uncharacterized protein n=1 Tax=Streptomyces aidingensis TaxID=910347 RepID=A0A1I1VAA2_9ACTN|nr:hypothetical protein [Streptomyces aidingensis]SFD79844.1 hypothetical protein SAMN05421773_1325 [Streptomyces aidingensis]